MRDSINQNYYHRRDAIYWRKFWGLSNFLKYERAQLKFLPLFLVSHLISVLQLCFHRAQIFTQRNSFLKSWFTKKKLTKQDLFRIFWCLWTLILSPYLIVNKKSKTKWCKHFQTYSQKWSQKHIKSAKFEWRLEFVIW